MIGKFVGRYPSTNVGISICVFEGDAYNVVLPWGVYYMGDAYNVMLLWDIKYIDMCACMRV